jgi:hypothetical protein
VTIYSGAVSAAYSAGAWTDFGTAAATAAAALAGLLFIAVSINLAKILDPKYPNLPGRAAITLILLAIPLISSILLLTPGQSRIALGLELLLAGLVLGVGLLVINHRTPHSPQENTVTIVVGRVGPVVVTCGSLVIAGATLLGQVGGGLYWLLPTVLAAFVSGLLNVWVLMVEIVR